MKEVVDAGKIAVSNHHMKWKGKNLKTIAQVCDAMEALKNKEEAQKFLASARKANPQHADANIGYLMGYFSRTRWVQLSEWFGVSHPIFGNQFDLSDEQIFQMGVERGKAIRRAKK